VSGSIKSRTGVIILTKTSKLSHLPAIQTKRIWERQHSPLDKQNRLVWDIKIIKQGALPLGTILNNSICVKYCIKLSEGNSVNNKNDCRAKHDNFEYSSPKTILYNRNVYVFRTCEGQKHSMCCRNRRTIVLRPSHAKHTNSQPLYAIVQFLVWIY
jgi:hypothetical protein